MLTLIRKLLNSFFLIVFLLLSAPTLLFLTKWYYSNLVMNKTYVGALDLPYTIEKSEETITAAKTLFASSDIKGIIINCDGHGGLAGVCQAIHADLIKLKQIYKKPIIAYIEKESLAGSYLIATAADFIVATNGSLIGCFNSFSSDSLDHEVLALLEKIKLDQAKQYQDIIFMHRPLIKKNNSVILSSECFTGEKMKELGYVDFIGGNLEVERIMRTKTVIEGSIEKVHGSFIEHFIFYISDLVQRTIRGFSIK